MATTTLTGTVTIKTPAAKGLGVELYRVLFNDVAVTDGKLSATGVDVRRPERVVVIELETATGANIFTVNRPADDVPTGAKRLWGLMRRRPWERLNER